MPEIADYNYVDPNATMPGPPMMLRCMDEAMLHSEVPRRQDDRHHGGAGRRRRREEEGAKDKEEEGGADSRVAALPVAGRRPEAVYGTSAATRRHDARLAA